MYFAFSLISANVNDDYLSSLIICSESGVN